MKVILAEGVRFVGSIILMASILAMVAIVLLGGVSSSPSTVTAQPPSPSAAPLPSTLPVAEASDPEGEAMLRLADSPGGKCQAWLSTWSVPPAGDIDARVDAAGRAGNWLEPDVWIGDATSAMTAFGATWAARSDAGADEIWIETTRDGYLLELKLAVSTRPGGHQIWRAGDSARVRPCSADGE